MPAPEPEEADAAKDLDTPVGLAVVNAVVSGLSRGVEHKELAKSVGVTVYVVEAIAANRKWWAKYPPRPSKQRKTRPASTAKTRGRKGFAPEGVKIVEPYRCGDHRTIFLPCLICITRNRAKKP